MAVKPPMPAITAPKNSATANGVWSCRSIVARACARAMPIDTAVAARIRQTTSAKVANNSTPRMRHRVILFVETGDAKPAFPVSSVMILILRESVRCVTVKSLRTLAKLLRNKGDSAFLVNGVLTPRALEAINYRCVFSGTFPGRSAARSGALQTRDRNELRACDDRETNHSAGMAAAGLYS